MAKLKKILVVTFSNISDHQDKVSVLYEELLEMGFDVYIVLPQNVDIECEKSDRTWFVKCPDRPGVTKGTFNFINLGLVIRKIIKGKFDIIFFETLHVWNLPIMLLIGKKTKIFQMIHDVIPHKGDKGEKLVDLMNRTVIKLANEIIICNKKYKESLCERYSANPNKVRCIELWERFPAYKETRRKGHMLFFGRLNPYKGADNLLEIVKQCPGIQFDVVGKADSQVLNIINELKQYPNVTVNEGYIADDEIVNVFDACDWCILPYNSATQSGVVVEAYKNSKPVICFDVGAISEQVQNGATGFLIASGDVKAFANKINEVSKISDDDFIAYCKRGYEYGYQQFSAKKAAEKIFMDSRCF